MMKRYNIFLSALFCVFLGVFSLLLVFLPKSDFSPNENRPLAQLPALTGGGVVTGSYMKEFETYLTDQFPFRDNWIAVKARAEQTMGKGENNGIYLCTDDTLIPRFDVPDADRVEKNFGYVDQFTAAAGVPVYFALMPGKVSVWADRLPPNAPNADELAYIHRGLQTKARQCLAYAGLLAHVDEDIYYRTDHHWTSLGAYYAYASLMADMGITPVPLSDYDETVVSEDFYGTAWSTSGARWLPPDRVTAYVPDDGIEVIGYQPLDPIPGALYVAEKLTEKDKYQYFLGGVQPRCVIKTAQTDAPRLLIVRDSFADAMVPFLTAHFSEIHLIDPRYYKAPLPAYIEEHGIDTALVLYSVANFTTDTNLFVLGL